MHVFDSDSNLTFEKLWIFFQIPKKNKARSAGDFLVVVKKSVGINFLVKKITWPKGPVDPPAALRCFGRGVLCGRNLFLRSTRNKRQRKRSSILKSCKNKMG